MQNRQNHTGLDQNPLSEYAHYTEVPQHFPGLITPNRIQWMIRNRFENGLNQHVLKIGKTLYVHLPSFATWLDSQRGMTQDQIATIDDKTGFRG